MPDCRNVSPCQCCYEQGNVCDPQSLHPLETRLFDSNYTPSDAEDGRLRRLASEKELELARYQDQFAVLRRDSEGCRPVLSVQRRVPVELWETIFSILCTSLHEYSLEIGEEDRFHYGDADEDVETDFETPTLTLSQVCHHWREIVHSSPHLWSSIKIQLIVPEDVTPLVKTYLEHAKSSPLHLRISFPLEDGYDRVQRLSRDKRNLWKLLEPRLPQARELVLGVANMKELPRICPAFPNLVSFRSLSAEFFSTSEILSAVPNPSWFWNAIHGAPRLTDVDLGYLLPRSWLPYPQLESIKILHIFGMETCETLLHLLPHCTSLVSLQLGYPDFCSDEAVPPALEHSIEVPSLRHLILGEQRVSMYSFTSDCPFFSICCPKLKLPALESFNISCIGWPLPLTPFLQQCTATLERLTIYLNLYENDNDSTEHVLALFPTLPHLNHLELDIRVSANHTSPTVVLDFFMTLLSKLHPRNLERTPFLPKLETLHLISDDDMHTELAESVLDVLSSRRVESSTCALTSFRLTRHVSYSSRRINLALSGSTLDRMNALRADGIHVVFESL